MFGNNLRGANSSPIVTKLCQWPRDEVIKFWKVKVSWGGMRSTGRPSRFVCVFTKCLALPFKRILN